MATHRPKRDPPTGASGSSASAAPVDDGVNPHMPQFISQTPWYLAEATVTATDDAVDRNDDGTPAMTKLIHHRLTSAHRQPKDPILRVEELFPDKKQQQPPPPQKVTTTTTVRRAGAAGGCENCGARDHRRRDCLERPRRPGSTVTQASSSSKITRPSVEMRSYDGKRDRWQFYDPRSQQAEIDRWHRQEAERLAKDRQDAERQRAEKEKQKQQAVSAGGVDADLAVLSDDEDDVDQREELGKQQPATKPVAGQSLRIREDTAKYLLHSDAYYDPKSRSMRAVDAKHLRDPATDFVRMNQAQKFAWEAYERGVDVNLSADPTRVALMQRQFEVRRREQVGQVKKELVEKYGGEEHLKKRPEVAQSEVFVEYLPSGEVKQVAAASASTTSKPSKYVEDDYERYAPGHTSVYGSWYSLRERRWGYACCHSTSKRAYCSGEAGRRAVDEHEQELATREREVEETKATEAMAGRKRLVDEHVDRLIKKMKDDK